MMFRKRKIFLPTYFSKCNTLKRGKRIVFSFCFTTRLTTKIVYYSDDRIARGRKRRDIVRPKSLKKEYSMTPSLLLFIRRVQIVGSDGIEIIFRRLVPPPPPPTGISKLFYYDFANRFYFFVFNRNRAQQLIENSLQTPSH